MHPRPKVALSLVPRDEFHSPAVDLLQTPADLLPPLLLGLSIDFRVQAFEERVGESRTGLRW